MEPQNLGSGDTLENNDFLYVDNLYSIDEIQKLLKVGNAGGVRACLTSEGVAVRVVVMTSLLDTKQIKENPYHDRIEGDILVYTGAGREGNQSLGGINKRIPQQINLMFPIYCFEIIWSRRNKKIGPKRWRFLGLLEYLKHYPDFQIDVHGSMRQVWLFEFRIYRDPNIILIKDEQLISSAMILNSKEKYRSDEDREIAMREFGKDNDSKTKENPEEIEALRSRLLATSPRQFECVIKELLTKTGFERADVTKYSQDGGIDVNAYAGRHMWPIESLLVQVQAKRWLHSVGRKEVAELRGSLQPFAHGSIVTTSHFSKAAIKEAYETGKNPIVLLDGYQLATLIKSVNLDLK